MIRNAIALAVPSMLGLLVLVVGLDVLTGVFAIPSPTGTLVRGGLLVALAMGVLVLAFPFGGGETD
ncbi:hypothetical protein [Natronolimnohabitans innermongolicus]|uniref:Uncharacterized protein n=1 Tax=Natronolimnohabitans innermongolicus JCM 12255 TaxID=1227499 RepID=L9X1B3_9EURY|nr:hypothetical protein [Natronolimnohabitans innermongolicus]ELY55539.1 hypothetical protein C493_11267 [Natronolimnohabitans innermongolicus JCM 12255]